MKLSDSILVFVSTITRKISIYCGTSSLYRLINSSIIKIGLHRLFIRFFLRLGAKPVVTAKMNDNTSILVDLRTSTEYSSFFNGEYDSDLIGVIRHLLNPDYSFLDIGANIGFYSVAISAFISSKKSSGLVFSFEPMDSNFNRLNENLNINNLTSHCFPFNVGLSNQSGDSQIILRQDFQDGSDTGNCSISINEEVDYGFAQKPIKLERLDEFWSELNVKQKIDIIKMDIEGHEDFCLEGGQKVIREHRPTILMEVNKPYYIARGVKLDERFLPLIPEKYSIFRMTPTKWTRISSFDECNNIDNVFLIPQERLKLALYQIFN